MTIQIYVKEEVDRLTTEHKTYERLLAECREALVYVVSLDGGGPKDMSPSKWVGGFLMYLDEETPCQVEIIEDDCGHDLITPADSKYIKWGESKICTKCRSIFKPDGTLFMRGPEPETIETALREIPCAS